MSPAAKSESRSGAGDSADTKKRKMNDSGNASSKLPPKSSNLYAEITKMEERQSDARTAEQDSKIFAENCNQMKILLDQMLEIKLSYKTAAKNSGAPPTKEAALKVQQELTDLRIKFSMMFLTLKKLNRLDKIRTKKIRETTNASKQRVDAFHLQLQNLRYEVMHLQKEVAKCLQFRSRDQDFDLVSVEEFYEKAPPEVSKKEKTLNNEHEQRLARLEYENLQRKEMSEDYDRLEKEKHQFEAEILERKTKLASLKPQLAAILEKTKPVQDYLEMPLDEERDQSNLAKYLPYPLFVLFVEMRAYGAVCDKLITVVIKGDIEEAKSANAAKRKYFQKEMAENEEDEEDNLEEIIDEEDQDVDVRNKKGNMSRDPAPSDGCATVGGDVEVQTVEISTVGVKSSTKEMNSKAQKIKRLFTIHPLTVEVKIAMIKDKSESDENTISMVFTHLTHLEIITAKVSLGLNLEGKALSAANREVLTPETLFSHLLTNYDIGNTSPNPNTEYQLTNLLADGKIPQQQIQEFGMPYQWAQKLGGLSFLENKEKVGDASDKDDEENAEEDGRSSQKFLTGRRLCQTYIESIVLNIRERFLARLSLARQLSVLEKAKLTSVPDLQIPFQFQKDFPTPKTQFRIRAWSTVEWEQYAGLVVTRHLVETKAVTCNDFFFRLQVNRDPATLIALIAIGPHYPYSPPVFCLNLHWNGEHNMHNSENMRFLEKEVNTCYENLINTMDGKAKRRGKKFIQEAKDRNEILSLQISKLMTCADVLLESWNSIQPTVTQGVSQSTKDNGIDFAREKLFLQPVRGRNRAPPLKYQSQLQLFTQ